MQQRSRSPAFLDAVPDRHEGDGAEREAGSFVPADLSEVRCLTPGCRRKLGDGFHGTITIQCPRCRQKYQFTRP